MASPAYLDFMAAVREYLISTDSTGPGKGKSNKQIIQAIRLKIDAGELDVSFGDGTMLSYLSQAANQDPNSQIVSGGVGQGYWIEPTIVVAPELKPADQKQIKSGKGKATIAERDLYPLMELWLNQKGYAAKDTSTLKSGGRWGNPDIIGIKRVDLFGAVEIDLASCEIKLGEDGWEQVIFEAISHKRFSNRSWFCYRINTEGLPLPKGMEYYAERYKVGVVQIILSDEDVLSLNNKSKLPLDFIDRVIERVPALHDGVPLSEQKDVVERTGIMLTVTF